jgi:dipeptide/tripeptide permease
MKPLIIVAAISRAIAQMAIVVGLSIELGWILGLIDSRITSLIVFSAATIGSVCALAYFVLVDRCLNQHQN